MKIFGCEILDLVVLKSPKMSLQNLNLEISSKQERLDTINHKIELINSEIEKLSTDSTHEDINSMLENALKISQKRQELSAQRDVLAKAASVTRQDLSTLFEQLQEVEIEDYLKQLRDKADECNETLAQLKTQFASIKVIAAKLSTMPIKRQPITYSYRANLPRFKLFETTIFVEEDLRSSLDAMQFNLVDE